MQDLLLHIFVTTNDPNINNAKINTNFFDFLKPSKFAMSKRNRAIQDD